MHPQIQTLLESQGGVAAAAQVIACGVSRYGLRRLVAQDQLVRLPRGIIVDPTVWQDAAPWDRHLLRARGLMHGSAGAADSAVALSHHSALSVYGAALHAVDDRIHIVRTDDARSRTDDFVQSHSPVDVSATEEHSGVRIVVPALAVLQTAATFGVESGLVSADFCLRERIVTSDRLQDALSLGRFGNGRTWARLVVENASGLAESAGESRCRWLFCVLGLPTPTEQAVICDGLGQFVGRVDFLFKEQRTIVEFDGRVKYTEPQVLFQEKQREDALRALGYTVVRIVWDDLAQPHRVLAKITAAFQTAGLAHRR